jgi:hypothetical protein
MLCRTDAPAVTGLAQARRLYYAVARMGELQNSVFYFFIRYLLQSTTVVTLLYTLRPWRPNIELVEDNNNSWLNNTEVLYSTILGNPY